MTSTCKLCPVIRGSVNHSPTFVVITQTHVVVAIVSTSPFHLLVSAAADVSVIDERLCIDLVSIYCSRCLADCFVHD